jgi:hypothetical protein
MSRRLLVKRRGGEPAERHVRVVALVAGRRSHRLTRVAVLANSSAPRRSRRVDSHRPPHAKTCRSMWRARYPPGCHAHCTRRCPPASVRGAPPARHVGVRARRGPAERPFSDDRGGDGRDGRRRRAHFSPSSRHGRHRPHLAYSSRQDKRSGNLTHARLTLVHPTGSARASSWPPPI